MLERLDRDQRLQLMKFVCAFAWADLEVRSEERAFVDRMVEHLGLDESELRQVRGWLESPPPAEAVDPMSIPDAHRKLFLQAIESVITIDGEIADEERESFEILRELLA